MTKILVIEDEEDVRANLLELLEAENFDTLEAKNGKIGVEVAREHKPDLIICDIMMPDLDGYGVLTALKSEPSTAIIPLIFLTAKDTKADTRKGMNLGADDYLSKPCTPEELMMAVTTRLQKHGLYMQQYTLELERAKGLQQKVKELQKTSTTAEDLLQRICQELRDPLSTINLGIQMLKVAPTQEARERYLKILQEECSREIALINQLSNLQNFISPENVKMLGRFRLFESEKKSD